MGGGSGTCLYLTGVGTWSIGSYAPGENNRGLSDQKTKINPAI